MVFPVPLGPRAMTFSARRRCIHWPAGQLEHLHLVEVGIALKSKLSRLLTAGNRAA